MGNCRNCGAPIDDADSRKCVFCGSALDVFDNAIGREILKNTEELLRASESAPSASTGPASRGFKRFGRVISGELEGRDVLLFSSVEGPYLKTYYYLHVGAEEPARVDAQVVQRLYGEDLIELDPSLAIICRGCGRTYHFTRTLRHPFGHASFEPFVPREDHDYLRNARTGCPLCTAEAFEKAARRALLSLHHAAADALRRVGGEHPVPWGGDVEAYDGFRSQWLSVRDFLGGLPAMRAAVAETCNTPLRAAEGGAWSALFASPLPLNNDETYGTDPDFFLIAGSSDDGVDMSRDPLALAPPRELSEQERRGYQTRVDALEAAARAERERDRRRAKWEDSLIAAVLYSTGFRVWLILTGIMFVCFVLTRFANS